MTRHSNKEFLKANVYLNDDWYPKGVGRKPHETTVKEKWVREIEEFLLGYAILHMKALTIDLQHRIKNWITTKQDLTSCYGFSFWRIRKSAHINHHFNVYHNLAVAITSALGLQPTSQVNTVIIGNRGNNTPTRLDRVLDLRLVEREQMKQSNTIQQMRDKLANLRSIETVLAMKNNLSNSP